MSKKMKVEMKKWMERNWGKKCPDYDAGCPLCKAWKSYEYLFQWVDEK